MKAPTIHSEEDVGAALAAVDALEVVRDAFIAHHRRRTVLPAEACLRWQAPDGGAARSIAMHAYLPAPPRAGIKLINGAINNPGRGIPRAMGIIALFDPLTAQITDLLPAAEISATRTAAVSTLAAQCLTRQHPKRLAILGAGFLAATHARMIPAALCLEELVVFDIERRRAEDLVNRSSLPRVHVAASAEDAVQGADVVVTATTVTEPYLEFEWLAPGCVVLNVSLDDLRSEVFMRADALYVDDWTMVTADSHRQLGKLAREGRIVAPGVPPASDARAITAELGALFAGDAPQRSDEQQRIVVNPFGLAISDISLAAAIRASIGSGCAETLA